MKIQLNANATLALTVLGFSLIALFAWIPTDIETGIVEKVRRRFEIGDALAPTVAAAVLGVSALLLLLESRLQSGIRIRIANLRYLATLLLLIGANLLLIRWGGPLTVMALNALGADLGEYRQLRASFPWSWVGFVLGGGGLVASLIGFIEGRISRRAVVVGLVAAVSIAAFYTLPFEDLQLPPNGDL